MYREPADSRSADEVLHTSTVGVSPVILGLLAFAPVFLSLVGVLLNSVAQMFVFSLPFMLVFALLMAARKTVTVTTSAVRTRQGFVTRTLDLRDVSRLACPHPSAAGLAVSRSSRLAASLLLWSADGKIFALPDDVPREVLVHVAKVALPPAVKRAEAIIQGGGTYRDPDGLSSIDTTKVHGIRIGMLSNQKAEANLDEVTLVDRGGHVSTRSESFMIGGQDLVLRQLLVRRGIANDVPPLLEAMLSSTDEST